MPVIYTYLRGEVEKEHGNNIGTLGWERCIVWDGMISAPDLAALEPFKKRVLEARQRLPNCHNQLVSSKIFAAIRHRLRASFTLQKGLVLAKLHDIMDAYVKERLGLSAMWPAVYLDRRSVTTPTSLRRMLRYSAHLTTNTCSSNCNMRGVRAVELQHERGQGGSIEFIARGTSSAVPSAACSQLA